MSFEGKRVVVTGASGFIGTHVCRRLAQDGAIVRAVLHLAPPQETLPGVTYVTADLTKATDCGEVVADQDLLFMCAANTAGAAVMQSTPLAQVTPNVLMNTQMLEAAHRAGLERFVFISSGAAYPATGQKPALEEDMFAAEPEDVYYAVAWMKRYAEILCRTYAEKIANRMAVTIVRPSNVYGPFDKFDPQRSHFTGALVRRVASRETPMTIWGTGNDIRDLIYIDDFINGLMLAVAHGQPFFVVNIGSGIGVSVRQVLETLLEVDGFVDAAYQFDPSKPSTTPIRLVDVSRAQQILDFQAHTLLQEGLAKTLAWYRGRQG